MSTDYEALAAMNDEEIDCSDLPAFTKEWLDNTEGLVTFPKKEFVSLSIDKNVLEFFRSSGKNYQAKINEVLKGYVNTALNIEALAVN